MGKRPPQPDSPNSLDGIQRLMTPAVMRPLTSGERMQRTRLDGKPTAEIAARFIKPTDRLSSFDWLQIYNQQYWWRILGSLIALVGRVDNPTGGQDARKHLF